METTEFRVRIRKTSLRTLIEVFVIPTISNPFLPKITPTYREYWIDDGYGGEINYVR